MSNLLSPVAVVTLLTTCLMLSSMAWVLSLLIRGVDIRLDIESTRVERNGTVGPEGVRVSNEKGF